MDFYLNFKSDAYGKKKIDEPIGVNAINFSLKQKDKGHGRDISFSGGDVEFEFSYMRTHELQQILYYNRKFGFESEVVLIIEIDADNKYECDLDFATAKTDDLKYFKCKGIQQGSLQLLNRRKSVKVDLFSEYNVDGAYIGRLQPSNMLIQAKPVAQTSEWTQSTPISKVFTSYGQDTAVMSPVDKIIDADINNTLSPLSAYTTLPSYATNGQIASVLDSLVIVEAQDNLSNATLSVTGLTANVVDTSGYYTRKRISIQFSKTFIPGEIQSIDIIETTGSLNLVNANYNIPIPNLDRGTKMCLTLSIFQPYNFPGGTPVGNTSINITLNGGVKLSVESTAYSSVAPSVRLIDAMRQVVKSITGLSVYAPRFEPGGEFYDNRILTGNTLRNITNRPFYISLEDLAKSLTEMNADYEIASDGRVFFGIEQDFYTNNQCWFFPNVQFSEMQKTFNPKMTVNEFIYKYDNFQSLKENEEPNSADTIHGESILLFYNKNVENKREVLVDWTRDAFLIEATRKKALEITDATASQDDDTLFCIDSIDSTSNKSFTESTLLEHTYDSSGPRLILRSDGSVNFVSLGIQPGTPFVINTPDYNAANYTVESITVNTLLLLRSSGSNSSGGNGTRLTSYTYTITNNFAPFTNYTDQGFSETVSLGSAGNFSNRRYSITRNIFNYYKAYLAGCNLYWSDKPLRNTWYKNNGRYTARYAGILLREDADFLPNEPLLTPTLYTDMVFKDVEFSDFIQLSNNIRNYRGFIRVIDNNDKVIRVHPADMDYFLLSKELRVNIGEERYEPKTMNISNSLGFILINSETTVDTLIWEIKDNKLYVFDENRQRLYNGVYWMEVAINDVFPGSIEELEEWLNLLN